MTDKTATEPQEDESAVEKEEEKIVVPERIDINEFQNLSLNELHQRAQEADLRVAGIQSKHQLVFELLKFYGGRPRLR